MNKHLKVCSLLLPLLLAACGSLQAGVEPPTVQSTLTRAASATVAPSRTTDQGTPLPGGPTAAGPAASASPRGPATAGAPTNPPPSATPPPTTTREPAATATTRVVPQLPTTGPANTQPPAASTPPAPTSVPTNPPPTATSAPTAFFQADSAQFTPGAEVTLRWSAPPGQTGPVSISLLSAQGARPGLNIWRDLPPSGSLVVKLDLDPRGPYLFELAPQTGDWPGVALPLEIPVRFACPDSFFFVSGGAPWPSVVPTDPATCPESMAQYSVAFQQDFEGGRMMWLVPDKKILVLYGDGRASSGQHDWAVYDDPWQEGEPENDPSLTPPEGRYQPEKGAGQIWRDAPGVRERLGWALAPAQTYIAPDQRDWAYPGADVPTYRYLRSAADTLLVLTDYSGHGRSPFWVDFGQ